MITSADQQQLAQKGISESQLSEQLQSFRTGFPFLKIIQAASPENGILVANNETIVSLLDVWENYLKTEASILKFVPASGAASRMFKDLFEFLDASNEIPTKAAEKKFFDDIQKFAFYEALNSSCLKNEGFSIADLMQEVFYKKIVANLLKTNGLNYGSLPKGLLLFHSYTTEKRTALQEHLVEGAMYASNVKQVVNIHFTVSTEHRALFEEHIHSMLSEYENALHKKFSISFSEQKPSTDTLAADENNEPFRENGKLVFRPGGHGALIENLNDLSADIIFIKNIDNVVPDSLKNQTVIFKKVIAGLLVKLQHKTFEYLKVLENDLVIRDSLVEIALFSENELNNHKADWQNLSDVDLKNYLQAKLNRPLRVCGMVKNTGEPGGGPFLTVNQDGTVSTQILESSQIDLNNPIEKQKMLQATHFNPVDLVCAVKDYKGQKFNLLQYVDKQTGFISLKSKNGKELKALELPGLWNGAMSDWNTVFVEVPIETFNPVKTVNDLLRTEHQ
ncbi:MAG: NAD metabolism ATPase/kinase [Porphyromonadaceae bacterium CG2_30_38_12]|nr:MAG: NAD metabolism ATPase/kinase [Porphyromonadaceae bacterium CG2_30_38_12]